MTSSRAAKLAGMTGWDFAKLARKRDGAWVGGDGIDAGLEAVSARMFVFDNFY